VYGMRLPTLHTALCRLSHHSPRNNYFDLLQGRSRYHHSNCQRRIDDRDRDERGHRRGVMVSQMTPRP